MIGLVSGSPSYLTNQRTVLSVDQSEAQYLMIGLARPLTTCHLPCGVSTRPLSVSTISGLLAWPPGDLGDLESPLGEAGEAEISTNQSLSSDGQSEASIQVT